MYGCLQLTQKTQSKLAASIKDIILHVRKWAANR